MTRASEMCECGSERGYCDCGSCPRPDECLACHRLIASDGSCGCSEGCAPGASDALGLPTVLALLFVASILAWAVWSGVPT